MDLVSDTHTHTNWNEIIYHSCDLVFFNYSQKDIEVRFRGQDDGNFNGKQTRLTARCIGI